MRTLWKAIEHNRFMVIGVILALAACLASFGCESRVRGLCDQSKMVNRQQLGMEVDQLVLLAEQRVEDLGRQDELKQTLFNIGLQVAAGGTVNPLGIITTLGAIIGLGPVGDNIRKDAVIRRNTA